MPNHNGTRLELVPPIEPEPSPSPENYFQNILDFKELVDDQARMAIRQINGQAPSDGSVHFVRLLTTPDPATELWYMHQVGKTAVDKAPRGMTLEYRHAMSLYCTEEGRAAEDEERRLGDYEVKLFFKVGRVANTGSGGRNTPLHQMPHILKKPGETPPSPPERPDSIA